MNNIPKSVLQQRLRALLVTIDKHGTAPCIIDEYRRILRLLQEE